MYPGIATKNEFEPKRTTPISFKENATTGLGSTLTPAVNISEFPFEYCIQIAVPGLKREDFNIELNQGVIVISAQKNAEVSCAITDRCEFDYHDWARAFVLPEDADALLTNATYKNGELLIRIPRSLIAENKAMVTVYVY